MSILKTPFNHEFVSTSAHFRRALLAGTALGGLALASVLASALIFPSGARAQTLDLAGNDLTLPAAPYFPNAWLSGSANVTNNGGTGGNPATLSAGGGTGVYSGKISDGSQQTALTITSGFATLSGVNTYSGQTIVSGGATLQAGSATGLSPNSFINLGGDNTAVTLDLNGFNYTNTVGLYGYYGSTITNNGASAVTLTFSGGVSSAYYGTISDGSSPLALTLTGNASLTLAGGANPYTGLTEIDAGSTLTFAGGGGSGNGPGSGAILNNGSLVFSYGSGYGSEPPVTSNISGIGSLTQNGQGTVVLSGTNTYTGGTFVNADQSQLLFTSTAAIAGPVTLTNGGVAGVTYPLDQNFLNTITAGSVGVAAIGADGNNNALNFSSPGLANVSLGAATAACDGNYYCQIFNYTGALTPNSGYVYQLGGGNAILNIATNLSDNGGQSSVNQGGGFVGANTFGYTILSGINTYTYGTTITSGILQFASSAAIPNYGTRTITIAPFGVAAAGYAIEQNFLNSIVSTSQGTAALAANSSNNLDFSSQTGANLAAVGLGAIGQQTYSGTITPYSVGGLGTFYLGGGPAGNTYYYSNLTVTTVLSDANASGPGSTNQLIVNPSAFANPETVTLTNNETYHGVTLVQGGTLSLGDGTSNGNLINTPSVALQNFSALEFQEGAGPITFTPVITGNGDIFQIGPGTVTLTQVETYAGVNNGGYIIGGRTYIEGGTLQLAPNASIASSSMVILSSFYGNSAPPTFDISNAGAQTIQNLFGGSGSIVNLGANTLTIGVPGTAYLNPEQYAFYNPNSNKITPSFLGSILGTGGLVFQGEGTYVLAGTNSYSGKTLIATGTLQAGAALAFSPNSLYQPLLGATLDLAGYSQVIGSLQGQGNVTNSNATSPATLFLGGDNSSTSFSGQISDSGAAGALLLVKSGTGTFVLTGPNSYVGGTQLQQGTISVGDNLSLGAGALYMAPNTTLQFTTSGLNLANAIVFAMAAGPNIDTGSFTETLSGPISGSGSVLDKYGSGALILTNANTYSGGTNIHAGTIAVGNSSALGSGLLTMSGGTTLQFVASGLNIANSILFAAVAPPPPDPTFDTGSNKDTISGVISGSGSLSKIGSGELILTGANTYSGPTYLLAGTIGVGNNSALGAGPLYMNAGTTLQFVASGLNIANNIIFGVPEPTIDTGANVDTISGVLSGSGALTKIGSGALILTGTSPSFTGSTEVAAGALVVNGSIAASAVQVDSGTSLGGSGTVGAITALSGATLAPGLLTPYSTLNSAGAVTFNAGSTFLVNISAAGQNDKILAAGAATLNSAALLVQAANGSYAAANHYTLLTATGGVSGTFASTSISGASFAFLSPVVTYDANDVYLGFKATATFPSVANTPNQIATAGAIQSQGPGAVYNAVLGQSVAGARAAFDALSGEIHASAVSNAFNDSRLPREAVLDRLSDPFGAAPSSSAGFIASAAPIKDALSGNVLTTWGQAFGSSGHAAGDGNAASFNSTLGGFIFGADESIDDHYRLGVAGGYTQSGLSAAARGSAGDVYSTFGGLYGGASFNALQLRAGALYAYNRFETNRVAVFPGFAENLDSAYGGNTAQGFVEAGWRVPVNGFFPRPSYVEPFIGGAVVAINSASFAETGGAAALNGQSSTYDYGMTTLGLRGEAGLTDSMPLVARGLLAWRHVFGDVSPNSMLAFASTPSTLFSIAGAPVYRDAAMIEAGIDWRMSAQVSLGIYYSGALSGQGSENAIKGRFEARF